MIGRPVYGALSAPSGGWSRCWAIGTPPGYTSGLNKNCATIAELLHDADLSHLPLGKWHVRGVGMTKDTRNHPMNRGFDRGYGTGGGGNYFALRPLYLDRESVNPGADF